MNDIKEDMWKYDSNAYFVKYIYIYSLAFF